MRNPNSSAPPQPPAPAASAAWPAAFSAPPPSSAYPAYPVYPPAPSTAPAPAKPPPATAAAAAWSAAFAAPPPSSAYGVAPVYASAPATVPAATGAVVVPAVAPAAAGSEPQSAGATVSGMLTGLRERSLLLIAARRPVAEMFNPSAFSKPANAGEALGRLQRNFAYFRANYMLALLAVVVLGLVSHPTTVVALGLLAAAWFFLYFSRNGPLVLFDRPVDDATLLASLTVATVVVLLATNVGWQVTGSLFVAAMLIGAHGAFRSTNDLFLTEQDEGSAVTGTPAGPILPTYIRLV